MFCKKSKVKMNRNDDENVVGYNLNETSYIFMCRFGMKNHTTFPTLK